MSDKLFPCPDCGNLCSYFAKRCMKCGRKLSWYMTEAKIRLANVPGAQQRGCGFVLLMIIGMLAIITIIIVTLGHFDMLP